MKTINILYQNDGCIKDEIISSEIDLEKKYLVKVFLTKISPQEAVKTASEIKSLLPNAVIVGCAVSGVIYDGDIYEHGSLLSIIEFSNAQVYNHLFSTKGLSSFEVNESVRSFCEDYMPSMAFMFVADYGKVAENLIEEFSDIMPGVPVVGGTSGFIDENNHVCSYVFNEEEYIEEGINFTAIGKDFLLPYTNVVMGLEEISEEFTITKTDGDYIEEIDGNPATEFFFNNLAMNFDSKTLDNNPSNIGDILSYFPIVVQKSDVSRIVELNEENEKIRLSKCPVKENTKFKISYFNTLKSYEQWQAVYYDLQTTPAETVFCYSCFLRRTLLSEFVGWEINAFKKAKVCGAFFFGEIGTNKKDVAGYYKGTCSFFTMAEHEEYLDLNLDVFNNTDAIVNGANSLINRLSQIQSSELHSEDFIKNFKMIDEAAKERVLRGEFLDIKNVFAFMREGNSERKDKICVIAAENLKEVQSALTMDEYKTAKKLLLEKIKASLSENFSEFEAELYRYDENTVFFTVSENISNHEFTSATKLIYEQIKTTEILQDKPAFISKCAISLRGLKLDDLIEYLSNTPPSSEQDGFYICDDISKDSDLLKNEFKMVSSLKEIIRINSVIPYFQGIYDNQKNYFYAYEALMRLQEPGGKILFPGDFMEISKKYNLYLDLSLCMVLKVFELFEDREEIITINVSILDILSEEFQSKVFEKLDSMKHTAHFVFELVETEMVEDFNKLKDFMHKARRYGIKIAVDDFGAGYSNFIEIGNLDIDYLKINGSLTELLGTDSSYQSILQSIYYLSKKMGAQLIAECVETASMQKQLVTSGVRFSQGYFFSKPMPFEDLVSLSEANLQKQAEGNSANEGDLKDFFAYNDKAKKQNRIVYWGGMTTLTIAICAVLFFFSFNSTKVEAMNDEFLNEIVNGMSDKISQKMEDSSKMLLTIEAAISDEIRQAEGLKEEVAELLDYTGFDNIYISINGELPIDTMKNPLLVDEELIFGKANDGEIVVISPVKDEHTEELLILLTTPIFVDGEKVAEIFASYEVDNFANVLALRVFGGEAFFHLCAVDGTPIVISGDSQNLFKSGDMYDFIGTLNMKNGHTPSSIKQNMIDGYSCVLKYEVNGEERTAVMMPIHGTDWCVVSIMQNDITTAMAHDINTGTFYLSVFVVLIFLGYFLATQYNAYKNQKELMRALEASYFLTNSLQTSIETDPLTRTYSRATAIEKITDAIAAAKVKNQTHAFLILDVDNFKLINDTYGHNTGDLYLQEFVGAVRSTLRAGDIIGRIGGDEFLILLTNIGAKENAKMVIERIFENVNNISLNGVSLDYVSVSAGVSLAPQTADNYEELTISADKALYKAKNAGKNKFVFSDEIEA